MFTDNKGLSLRAANRHYEEIVALGTGAYTLAIKKIQNEISRLQESIEMNELSTQRLRLQLDNGSVDADGTIATAIWTAERHVKRSKESIRKLNLLHSHVTSLMRIPYNRYIGRVLFADPISVSSNGYTQDWAIIKLRKGAFSNDFEGNTLYIGMSPICLIT